MSVNYRGMNKKELTDICRSEPLKYRGLRKIKKDDLINFIYQKNSTNQRNYNRHRPYNNLSDCSHIFETVEENEERIQSYYEERPEETIIEDLISTLRKKYIQSTIIFDPHNDPNNDMIYRGNKGKYILKYGDLGEHGEGILYHGTDEKNLISILSDDFRLTSNPVHGHLYGKGIYFTNDIEKALYYSERGKSTKYVIVCNVHMGDICLGHSTMNIHPKMRNKDKQYDTSVDNMVKPKQFIKKKNGTYNILGIITINNYIDKSNNKFSGRSQVINTNKFSGGFQVINTKYIPIDLYWVPDYFVHTLQNGQNRLQKMRHYKKYKFMSIIPASYMSTHGTTKQLCQIGHTFICVDQSIQNIIRVFKSKQRDEIITI